jgi:hypothetical protein
MMKKAIGLASMAAAIILCAMGCTKESVENLSQGQSGVVTCDTTNSKYAADVVPILEDNCYTCHGSGNTGGSGGILLEGYSNLVVWTNTNGKDYLIGNITHAPGFVGMPFGLPPMDSCDINKIISWVNNGAQNN